MPALWYKFKSQKECHDTNLSMFCPYLQCSLRWIIALFITKQEPLCSYNLTLPGMRCFGRMSEFLLYVSEEGAQTCFLLGRNDRTVNAKYCNVTCQSFPLCHLSPLWPQQIQALIAFAGGLLMCSALEELPLGSTWYFILLQGKGAAFITSEGAKTDLAKSNFAENHSAVLGSNFEI